MFRELHLLAIPIAVSVAFYDAGFLVAAHIFEMTGPEIVIGVASGACVGICVLAVALWKRVKSSSAKLETE